MFIPCNNEILEKIQSIDLVKRLFTGEIATCYEYRNRVLAFINQAIAEVEDKSSLDEDLEIIYQWFQYRNQARFWQSAQSQKSPQEMAEWILNNAATELENKQAQESFSQAAGAPSESELEDVYQWIETSLKGSEAQIKWAKDIAHKHHTEIAIAWKKNKQVPTEAKWWIENRSNILSALNQA